MEYRNNKPIFISRPKHTSLIYRYKNRLVDSIHLSSQIIKTSRYEYVIKN